MYCSKCGTQNDNQARFCTKCGAPQSTDVPQAQTSQSQQQSPRHPISNPPSIRKIWYDNMLIVILLLFCCFPVGLVALILNRNLSKSNKQVIGCVFGVWFAIVLIGSQFDKDPSSSRSTGSSSQLATETNATVIVVADQTSAKAIARKALSQVWETATTRRSLKSLTVIVYIDKALFTDKYGNELQGNAKLAELHYDSEQLAEIRKYVNEDYYADNVFRAGVCMAILKTGENGCLLEE